MVPYPLTWRLGIYFLLVLLYSHFIRLQQEISMSVLNWMPQSEQGTPDNIPYFLRETVHDLKYRNSQQLLYQLNCSWHLHHLSAASTL